MSMRLTFKPVTPATAKDFEALFEAPGGPKYCWCMAFRATPDEIRSARGQARKSQMLGRIAGGVPVGLVGYADGRPAAWVSIAPRETFRPLGGPDAQDGEIVWSLTCLFVPRRLRGEGLGRQLVEAAIAQARECHATVLEAYPVAPDSLSYRHMGFISLFKDLGFEEVGQAGTRRHVVRLTLSSSSTGKGRRFIAT